MKLKTLIPLTFVAFALVLRAQEPPSAPADVSAPAEKSEKADAHKTGSLDGRVFSKIEGKALNNARVRVKGTNIEEFTDEFGEFRIIDLPAGKTELEIFYTGMETLNVPVVIRAGVRIAQDFELMPYGMKDPSGAKSSAGEETVLLDKFSVNARRETSGAAIAANEQRFSITTKTVIETDAYGEQTTGNIGDFLKFMPGVAVSYNGADPESVSVRGFGAAFISVASDGADLANTGGGEDTRAFVFDQSSLNNISRIEVEKMPTASTPADNLAGRVNLISKSAFESKKASFKYRLAYSLNSEDLEFMRKTPGPLYDYTYKALPGFAFDWTYPITKNFGIVLTGNIDTQIREKHNSDKQWNYLRNPMDRDLERDPFLQKYTMGTRPSLKDTQSAKIRADWRINRNHTFSLTYGVKNDKGAAASRQMTWDVKDVGVHSKNQGGKYKNREWGYSPEWGYFSESAEAPPNNTGGSIAHTVGGSTSNNVGNDALLKYQYKGNNWNIDGLASYSVAKLWKRDGDDGYFSSAKTKIKGKTGRIGIYQIDPNGDQAPAVLKAYASRSDEEIANGFDYGEEIDVFNIKNYTIDTVSSTTQDKKDTRKQLDLNINRMLGGLPFPAIFKIGGSYREQITDTVRGTKKFTLLPNVSDDADPMMPYKEASAYIDDSYSKVNPGWGLPDITWISPKKLYDTYLLHPDWFTPAKDQARDTAREMYRESKNISEAITAFYIELQGRFWDNRLAVSTGIRWEMTDDRGLGCYEPTEGDTAEDVYANWVMRGATSHRTYNDLYPSAHINYNVTENFKARFSYATTMKRPNFDSIIPSLKISNNDTIYESEIRTSNPNLKPYKSNNFDLSMEYYLPNGGNISGSVYYKRIANYFGQVKTVATLDVLSELGLGTDYLDYIVVSKFNLSRLTQTFGVEVSFDFPLTYFGEWGRDFRFMGNVTHTQMKADELADLGGFIKEMANFGIQYNNKRIRLGFMANFRGREKKGAQTASDYYQREPESTYEIVPFKGFYEYTVPMVMIDANLEFKFSKRITFYASARNITNEAQKFEVYNTISAQYAPYAKPTKAEIAGTTIVMGIKGSF